MIGSPKIPQLEADVSDPSATTPARIAPAQHRIRVLLIDDQAISAEAVRRWLSSQPDIDFHYCDNPAKAVQVANEVQPTVILQDLVMPDIDGLMLVKFFRVNASTRETPMIVLSSREEPLIKAEAFALGANDYLVKWPDQVELIARIRYHSKGYINLLQRNEAYAALAESQRELQREIDAGAKYVLSMLPEKMRGRVQIDWRYEPCVALAGDSLGYHWLDDDRLVIYVLDVTGHGIAAALLSVSVMNVLRSRSLPNVDFSVPGDVLAALNATFAMENHGDKCFTIWYGVYDAHLRRLSWAGAGHPPALLFDPAGETPTPQPLDSDGPIVGMMPWSDWATSHRDLAPGSRLYLYTDGAHEIHLADGGEWTHAEFVQFVSQPPRPEESIMDRLFAHVKTLKGSETLDDDFSIVEVQF
jgi:sigma-B regulation protein RsbU (phosphoserine phosphatase)